MKSIITYNKEGFKNSIFLVDDEDFEVLNKYNWHLTAQGYAATDIKIKDKWIQKKMHQILLSIAIGYEVDHKNRIKSDNRRSNLRVVTHQENSMNTFKRKGGTSQYKGVCWSKREEKWRSQITKDNKQYYLGYFNDEKEAARIYNEKAKELFGEFACLNEVLT